MPRREKSEMFIETLLKITRYVIRSVKTETNRISDKHCIDTSKVQKSSYRTQTQETFETETFSNGFSFMPKANINCQMVTGMFSVI